MVVYDYGTEVACESCGEVYEYYELAYGKCTYCLMDEEDRKAEKKKKDKIYKKAGDDAKATH